MSKQPLDLLYHIREELEFLRSEAETLSEELFQKDERAKRAFARSFEIIGEASKKFSPEFRNAHPELPWKEMARMRDRLIHHYFGVNYPVVWDTVVSDVPSLLATIEAIIEAEPGGSGQRR